MLGPNNDGTFHFIAFLGTDEVWEVANPSKKDDKI
jgi:hypothetical protein